MTYVLDRRYDDPFQHHLVISFPMVLDWWGRRWNMPYRVNSMFWAFGCTWGSDGCRARKRRKGAPV